MSQYASAMNSMSGCAARTPADHRRPVLLARARRRRARPRCARTPRWSSASPCRSARRRTARRCRSASRPTASRSVGRERVELHDVGPRREVRVAAAARRRRRRAQERLGVGAPGPPRVPRDEALGARRASTDGRARRGWARSRGSGRDPRSASAARAAARRPGRRSARRRRSRARSTASRSRPRRAGRAAPRGCPPQLPGPSARSPAPPGCAPTRPSATPRRPGSAAIASHSRPGTSSSVSGRPRARPSRSSHTAVLIS